MHTQFTVPRLVAIVLADRIAAIASVVGTVFGDEALPRTPASTLVFNGMKDANVPHAGRAPGERRGSAGRAPGERRASAG